MSATPWQLAPAASPSAAVAAMAAIAFCGLVLDQGLLRFVRGFELRQVLLTLGVAFMLNDLALVIWGGDTFTVPIPSFLQGAIVQFGVFYPKFRLFVLLVGVLVFIGLWLLLNRTRLGALIRAGVDDAEMVEASGDQHPPRVPSDVHARLGACPDSADCSEGRF